MDFRNLLEKLRGLPESQKRIVLWTIVAVLGIIMLYFWINSATKTISKFSESSKDIKFSEINVQK